MQLLSNLNKEQKEAITYKDGPLLILAGPGSGKTRVITYRIAYLIQAHGVPPTKILAITFTNKAADEMRIRLAELIGEANTRLMQISTFHSFAAKILRRYAKAIGFSPNYTIYDDQDQLRAIKSIIKQLRIQVPHLTPAKISYFISLAKNHAVPYEGFTDYFQFKNAELVQKIYEEYQNLLKKNDAMDFDDLLLNLIELFDKNPDILWKYQQAYEYIHVDEYQDTNRPQYYILKQLTQHNPNICVVGDENQSIYSFRGATIQNILDFEHDFPDAKVIKLEQNYRSVPTILRAATQLINHNTTSRQKILRTTRKDDMKINLYKAPSADQEAQFIASEIYALRNKYPFSEICVLYRTNAQSRVLEKYFTINKIPYKIFGTVRFFERKEIKDAIAYLKFINNPNDSISLLRIINTPPRGIGNVTINKIVSLKNQYDISLLEALRDAGNLGDFNAGQLRKIDSFLEILENLLLLRDQPKELITTLFKLTKLAEYYKEEDGERYLNLQEFINNATEFFSKNPDATLNDYLEDIALSQPTDDFEFERDYVSIMTLHNSKGLEFGVVFITGIEDGLLPHFNSQFTLEEIEEERRLLYVGMTRAKDLLYFTYTGERFINGRYVKTNASRFLREIDQNLFNNVNQSFLRKNYPSSSTSFKLGELVEHRTWGIGEIVSISGDKVVVEFPTYGRKNISLKYSVLRKI